MLAFILVVLCTAIDAAAVSELVLVALLQALARLVCAAVVPVPHIASTISVRLTTLESMLQHTAHAHVLRWVMQVRCQSGLVAAADRLEQRARC